MIGQLELNAFMEQLDGLDAGHDGMPRLHSVTFHRDFAMVDPGESKSFLWGMEISATLEEMRQSRAPVQQRYNGMLLKFNMDADEMAYIGDTNQKIPGLFTTPKELLAFDCRSSGPWKTAPLGQVINDVIDSISSLVQSCASARENPPERYVVFVSPTLFSHLSMSDSDEHPAMSRLASLTAYIEHALRRALVATYGMSWHPCSARVRFRPNKWLHDKRSAVVMVEGAAELPVTPLRRQMAILCPARDDDKAVSVNATYTARIGQPRLRFSGAAFYIHDVEEPAA